MTGFQDAVNWFYHWERSEILGTDFEQRLQDIFNPSLSEPDRTRLLDELLRENADSPRLSELLFQAGVRYRRLGLPKNGLTYFIQAIAKYTETLALHNLTCLRWLHGWVLWQTGSTLDACIQWRKAIEEWAEYLPVLALRLSTLDKEIENARLAALRCIELQEWHRARMARSDSGSARHRFSIAKYQVKVEYLEQVGGELTHTRQAVSVKQTWYQERLREMNVALAGKPDEAYLLVKDLAQNDPGRLSQGFITQRAAIETFIAEGKLDLVQNEVDNMIAAVPARTPVEKAETYLVSGWALYAIKKDGWEKHLQQAVFLYPAESLARVWARWLLGAIQWDIPEKRGEAADNWKIAIRDLVHLKDRAEWQNQPRAVNEYAEKLTAMHGALDIQRNQLASSAQEGS
jgi:tetratricopeptide (TPR) repeat protein